MTDVAAQTLLVGLVAWRVWRLAALDRIADPIRRRLYAAVRPDGTGPAAAAVEWLVCPWCAGFWCAGAVALAVDVWQGRVGVATVLVWWGSAAIVAGAATVTGDAE